MNSTTATATIDQSLIVPYVLIITSGIIGLLFSITFLFLILIHRQSHTLTYLLAANVTLSCSFYIIIVLYNHINALFYQTISPTSCLIVSYMMVSAAASISYSLMLQSISRLFFTIFYRYKQLLSLKIHICLLVFIWLVSFTLAPFPCYITNGLTYEPSLYICDLDASSIFVIVYVMVTGCMIPFSIIGFIYFYIMFYLRRQRHTSVLPLPADNTNSVITRTIINRNLVVLRNIMINVTIISFTGLPSFVIMILILMKKTDVTVTIYCTLFTLLGVVLMTITSFFLTKNLRKTFLKLIYCQQIN